MESSQHSSSETLGRQEPLPPAVPSDLEKVAVTVPDIPDGGLKAWLTVSLPLR